MGPLGVSAAPEGLLAEVWTLHSPGSCPASSLPVRGGRPCYAPPPSLGLCAVVAAPTKLEGASFSPRVSKRWPDSRDPSLPPSGDCPQWINC